MKTTCQASRLFSAVSVVLLLSCPVALGLPADKLVDGNPNTVQNEIDLTLIPGQQGRLAMAYNDDPNGGTPLGIGYSSDFGVSWNTTQLAMPSAPPTVQPPWLPNSMTTMFDPTITADANGNVFAAGIAAGANFGFSSLFGGGPDSGFFAYKSTDFGQTWGAPTQISYDTATQSLYEDPNYRFNDRCRIKADVYSGSSLYANNVYATWIKDRGLWDKTNPANRPLGDIYFSSLPAGGVAWNAPIQINQMANDMGNIPTLDVASDGTIYLAWLDYNVWTPTTGQIYMRQSTDGGANFTDWNGVNQDHPVATINVPPLNLTTGTGAVDVVGKGNSGTPIAVDPNNPSNLYIAYAADPGVPGDEADIFLIKSTNGGQTWNASPPVRVNDDATITDQAFPWIDIKPDGTIDVAWYDKRNSVNDDAWDVYIAKSVDGGASFSTNYLLSDLSFTAPSGWFGEYLGLAVDNTDAYVAFTSSVSDLANGDVWFDSVPNSQIPEAATLGMLLLGGLGMLSRRR